MKVIIIGAGTLAMTVADILSEDRNFRLAGFIGTENEDIEFGGKPIYGNMPILGGISLIGKVIEDGVTGFVAAVGDNNTREKRYYEALTAGLSPINAISRHAIIESSASIGQGVIICPGVILSHGVEVGDNTCIDPGVIVQNQTKIGENCLLGAGTIVGGLCKLGRNVFLEPRSTINHYVEVGKNVHIAMGEMVAANVSDEIRRD